MRHLADAAEAELGDFRSDDADERRIGVERGDRGDFWLFGQVLGQVAERATDLEDREVAGAAHAQVAKERTEEARASRFLVGQVRRRALDPLPVDQHLDHARAVGRGVLAPVNGEDAAVAEIRQRVPGLGHPLRHKDHS